MACLDELNLSYFHGTNSSSKKNILFLNCKILFRE